MQKYCPADEFRAGKKKSLSQYELNLKMTIYSWQKCKGNRLGQRSEPQRICLVTVVPTLRHSHVAGLYAPCRGIADHTAIQWVGHWPLPLWHAVRYTEMPSGFSESFRSSAMSILETPNPTGFTRRFLAALTLLRVAEWEENADREECACSRPCRITWTPPG